VRAPGRSRATATLTQRQGCEQGYYDRKHAHEPSPPFNWLFIARRSCGNGQRRGHIVARRMLLGSRFRLTEKVGKRSVLLPKCIIAKPEPRQQMELNAVE
jgi:hypothetical protein